MVTVTVPNFLKPFVAFNISVFYTAVVLFKIAVRAVKKPKQIFYVKKREVPPPCLSDPELGTHKYIKVNGIKLHYVEKGDSSKPLMLFVHGFPEFWYSWRYQMKEFSDDYWTVAIDQRGYGDSDKPLGARHYHIDNLAEDIKCLVDALGREKFTLVAHDWGAVVCWHFLGKYMSMVKKYVLMDAPSLPVWHDSVWGSKEQFLKSWYVFFFQMPKIPELFFKLDDMVGLKVIKGDNRNNTVSDEDLEAFKYTFSQPNALTCAINYYRAAGLKHVEATPPQRGESAPGLFLIGEHDRYISNDTGDKMQKVFNNLESKIVKGANHFIQQDDPVTVNKIMREFLK